MLIVNFSFFYLFCKFSYYICNVQENSQYFTFGAKNNVSASSTSAFNAIFYRFYQQFYHQTT